MRKHTIYPAILFLAAGLVISACSKNSTEPEKTEIQKALKVSIPAKFASSKAVADGGTATFEKGEKIYVYNYSSNVIDSETLTPDANAASANLVGELTETYYRQNHILWLFYNVTSGSYTDYTSQDGTLETVVDAAVATGDASAHVTEKTEETMTISPVSFSNIQSIFKFTFKHNGSVLNVKSVHIVSGGNNLVQKYTNTNGSETYGPITVANSTPLSTIYVGLRFKAAPNDPIYFIVMDEDGNLYTATKNAPATGFAINKFYNSTINVTAGITDGFDRFTVNSSKKVVYFSPGNLIYDGTEYSFETTPFSFSKGSLGYGGASPSATSARGYFLWSHIATANETPISFEVPAGSGKNNWRVLTANSGEWEYIFNNRTMTNSVEKYYLIRDLSGNFGILLTPDGASAADADGLEGKPTVNLNVDYKSYVAKGFVFLPAAGKYTSGSWQQAGEWGSYLSTSRLSGGDYKRLHMFPSGQGWNFLNTASGSSWDSVRLVHE